MKDEHGREIYAQCGRTLEECTDPQCQPGTGIGSGAREVIFDENGDPIRFEELK